MSLDASCAEMKALAMHNMRRKNWRAVQDLWKCQRQASTPSKGVHTPAPAVASRSGKLRLLR